MIVNRTIGRFILAIQRRVFVLLLFGVQLACSACEGTGPRIIERMKDSTLQVVCIPKHDSKKGEHFPVGSGFVIGGGKYVVTNRHVAAGCDAYNNLEQLEQQGKITGLSKQELEAIEKLKEFRKNGGLWVKGIVLEKEVDTGIIEEAVEARPTPSLPGLKDLAILEFSRPLKRPSVTFAAYEAKVGHTVYALGFPGAAREGMQGSMTLTTGIVSNLSTSDDEGIRYYQVSAPLNPGNSGGPLVDEDGNVLGVITLKSLVTVLAVENGKFALKRVSEGEGIGWAIESSELLAELHKLAIVPNIAPESWIDPVWRLGYRSPALLSLGLSAFALSLISLFFVFTRQGRAIAQGAAQSIGLLPSRPRASRSTPSLSPELKGSPRLFGAAGHFKGNAFEVDNMPITIGRDPKECQIVFPADMASIGRKHCTLRYDNTSQVFLLEDCGSRNGTFLTVGGRLQKGKPYRLQSGDKFYLSDATTMFEVRRE